MSSLELRGNYPGFLMALFALFLGISCCVCGCGSSDGRRLRENAGESEEDSENASGPWQRIPIAWIEAENTFNPGVRASLDGSGRIHIVYFYGGGGGADCPVGYRVTSLVLNWQSTYYLIDQGPETVTSVDNCSRLALTLTPDNCPVVACQGGALRGCNNTQQHQSDVMLSLRESGRWKSWIGAEGAVDAGAGGGDSFLRRAGSEVSVITDSAGCMHASYQLLSESCGAVGSSTSYADLYYIKMDRSAPDAQTCGNSSERVEEDQGDSPHFIGAHCAITLDRDENPMIFYYAQLSDQETSDHPIRIRGLRVARKEAGSGAWKKEWIEHWADQEREIASISCAKGSKTGYGYNGYIGVAYAVKEYTAAPGGAVSHLQYACTDRQFSSWQIQTVDDSSSCGEYCSLAFDSQGFPAIAYFGLQSFSNYSRTELKFARFIGSSSSSSSPWNREVVSPSGNIPGSAADFGIGLCNNLWFDDHNRPLICSYSGTQTTIYLFARDLP